MNKCLFFPLATTLSIEVTKAKNSDTSHDHNKSIADVEVHPTTVLQFFLMNMDCFAIVWEHKDFF